MKKKLLVLIIISWIFGFNNIIAQTPGNTCATATAFTLPTIPGNTTNTGAQTTNGNGNNYAAGTYCTSVNYGAGQDGVYAITVPVGGGSYTFTFPNTGNTYKILSIHSGCPITNSNCIGGFTTGTGSGGTVTLSLTAGTYYLVIDTWPSPDYANFTLNVTLNAPPTSYCIPAPTSVDGQGITNISFSTVNNTTGAETGNYGNYSAQVGTALEGTTLPVNITYRTGYTYETTIWIDWNDDFVFSPTEVVYTGLSTATNPTTLAASFNIPAGSATSGNGTGLHRMRIGGRDTGLLIDPCYTGGYASFEDYSLQIIVPATPTITSLSGTAGCVGTSLTISGTNLTAATAVTIGGTAASITANTTTSITVTVGAGTTGTVSVTTPGGTAISTATFTVNPLPALPPNTLTSNSPQCNPPGVTISHPGTAPAGITWYWQTAANGTSTANNAATPLVVTASGRIHIRAQNNATGCWSTGSRNILVVVNNTTPNAATTPNPANNATGVCYAGSSPVTSISWGNVANVTSYDVYFGTNPVPPLVSNQTTSTYNTGILAANTTYYWRIVPKNACGDTTGTVITWSFTTANGPCHCTPTGGSSSTSYYLNSIATTLGLTNINYTATSYTAYVNNAATTFSQIPGSSVTVNMAAAGGGSYYYYCWVDWNNDGDFLDTGETIYATTSYTSNYVGSIPVAIGQAAGNYRVRFGTSYIGAITSCGPASYGNYVDYTLSVATLTPCSGTPTGGTVTVNPTSGNPSSTYNVTASGYTIGTGLTYQWQYSDTGGAPWTNQGTATASYAALTGMIAPATLGVVRTWHLVITCTASASSANSSTGTFTTALTTCTPTNTSSTSYYISGVTTTGGVANITNTGTGFSGYTDYTSQFVSQYPGSNFSLTATHPSSSYGYNVWVDWNNDADFDDAGENVISTGYLFTPATLGPITIPGGQAPGNYRMRIRNAYLDNPAPACGSHNYGEAEDYTVTVLTLNCMANPQALTAISSTTTTATISWTHASPLPGNGYEYIISTDNTTSTPAGDITGSTTGNAVPITGLTPGTTYYVFVRGVCNAVDNGAWITTSFSTGCSDTVASPTLCPTIIIDVQGNNPFTANPFIIDPNANLDCSTDNVTLVANPNLRETTSYIVEKINYPSPAPLYDFPLLGGNDQAIHTDDHWADTRTNLGFPFCFYGNSYTQTLVGANGMITFNNSITPGSSCGWSFDNNLPSTVGNLFEQTIYGVYHDINPAGLSGTPIKSRTIGTAPCRQFQVSWHDIPMFSDASRLYTGMIVLHETTNIIEVFIEEKRIENGNSYPWNDGNAIVGIQGDITPLAPNNQYTVAPCRNGLDTNWETTNEAWRFTPNGAPITPSAIAWYQGSVAPVNIMTANADNSVTVTQANTYFAVTSFNTCSGTVNLTDEIIVNDNRKVWTSAAGTTDWYTPGNWTNNAIPTSADCVIIPDATTTFNRSPIVVGSLPTPPLPGLARSLRVLSNGYLELQPYANLMVTDDIYIEDTATPNGKLIIRDDGNLIQLNNTPPNNNIGSVQMQRTVTSLTNLNYVYWSSPVSNFAVTGVSPGTNANLIWQWIPTVASNGVGHYGTWQNTTENMLAGKGYIIRGISSTSPESTAALNTVEFIGVPRNGTIMQNITHGGYVGADYLGAGNTMATELDDNWNLVGNPYPSSISARKFIAQNASLITTDNTDPTITGTIYLWNHINLPSDLVNDPFYGDYVYNYNPNNYIAYNNTGANPPGFNGNIASGQAFFVLMDHNAPQAGSSVVFNNNMRFDDSDPLNPTPYANNEFFRTIHSPKSQTNRSNQERHRIWLDLIAPNNLANSILVGYVENATNEVDRLYDGFDLSETSTKFYSLIEEDKMAIQGKALPFIDTDMVPLGVLISQNGNYTIAINSVDGLFLNTGQDIFLEDTYNDIIHDLRSAPFSFTSESGTFNDRFILRYTNNALSIPEETVLNGLLISAPSNNYIKVTSRFETIKSVSVYDVLGRSLFNNKNVNQKELILNNLSVSNGTYIVKVTLSNGLQKTQKIVLK